MKFVEAAMGKQAIQVSRIGNTITVKTETYREVFDAEYKTRGEIIDYCMWLARTGGVQISHETAVQLLKANKVIT
jgi:hypothetical protein